MVTFDELKKMSAGVRETINKASYDEATGVYTNHSYSQIIKQEREPAIAARMLSKPKAFPKCSLNNNGSITMAPSPTIYDAKAIVKIFVDSVTQNGQAPYPLTGDWSKTLVKQLYLFISGTAVARFTIKSVQKGQIPLSDFQNLLDPTIVLHMTYKSYAIITDVKTNNLPQDFIGNYSGMSVHKTSFKGSAPLVYII